MSIPRRLLEEVGRVVPSDAGRTSQLFTALTPQDAAEFLELVTFHRVSPQVHTNLKKTLSDPTDPHHVLDRVAELAAKYERVLGIHERRVRDLAIHSGIDIVPIKGMALSRYYDGETGCRHISDADVLVAQRDAWSLIEYLPLHEYKIEKIRFGRYQAFSTDSAMPRYCGICPAAKDFPEGKFDLDLHFGAFPACGYGLIPIEEHATVKDADGVTWPTAQKSLVINLAHVIRQGFCRLRDVNDLYLLARSIDGESAAAVIDEVRARHLLPLLRSMLRICRYIYKTDLVLATAADASGPMRRPDHELLFGRRDRAEGYADDVRLIWSRGWQVRYLIALYAELFGTMRGISRAVPDALQLFRSGRPYKLWQGDRSIDTDERFVILPVAILEKDIDGLSAGPVLEGAGLTIRENPALNLYQIPCGNGVELIISRRLVCVQASYDGSIANERAVSDSVHDFASAAQVTYRSLI